MHGINWSCGIATSQADKGVYHEPLSSHRLGVEPEARGRSLPLSARLLPAPLSPSPPCSWPHWAYRSYGSYWPYRTCRYGGPRSDRTHRSNRTDRPYWTRNPWSHRPHWTYRGDWPHWSSGYPRP